MRANIIPELYCLDIEQSKAFYLEVLGFKVKYERPHEQFAFLERDGLALMLEGLQGEGRRWITAELSLPFGRGINLQWDVEAVENLYYHVQSLAPHAIYLPLETKSYQCNNEIALQKQFIVQDPNGYLFRFCENIAVN